MRHRWRGMGRGLRGRVEDRGHGGGGLGVRGVMSWVGREGVQKGQGVVLAKRRSYRLGRGGLCGVCRFRRVCMRALFHRSHITIVV